MKIFSTGVKDLIIILCFLLFFAKFLSLQDVFEYFGLINKIIILF